MSVAWDRENKVGKNKDSKVYCNCIFNRAANLLYKIFESWSHDHTVVILSGHKRH